jgi:photosystem II stability/assembly factor-like uncharacterized protein
MSPTGELTPLGRLTAMPRPSSRWDRTRWRAALLAAATTAVSAVWLMGPSGNAAPAFAQSDVATLGILTGVSCPIPSVCVSTGQSDPVNGGAVIGTTDGGRTWGPLATPPGVGGLAGVACPTKLHCEVVGNGNGDAGAIYGTRNGGRTWHAQPAVLGGGLFQAIACPSETVCEATGNAGTIVGTINGGMTWTRQATPAQANLVEGVSCPTTTTCEAVGFGGTGMALRTVNGGSTWSAQTLPPSVQDLSGVACPTVRVCVSVGQNAVDAGSREVGVVATTSNGGHTWKRRHIPAGFADLVGVACPTALVCEAAGLGPTAVIGTTDGGTTWTTQPIPGSMFLQDVSCPRPQRCEAVGQDSNGDFAAFGTVNAGQTWTQQPISAGN